jgi:transcriptional regulator with XRE-family HTH domain
MTSETPAERALLRVRAEMARKKMSQRDVAGILDWSQSRVSKNLNERIELGVNDLGDLCFAVGISLTEAVRDQGLEFCAELTPTEVRVLEGLRHIPQGLSDYIVGFILHLSGTAKHRPERHAGPLDKPRKRP